MHLLIKFIFWTSIALIATFVLLLVLGAVTPLEFTNEEVKSTFERVRFIGLPIAILLTLFGTLKNRDSKANLFSKVFLTLLAVGISIAVLFFSLFAGMCNWSGNQILFENRKSTTTKIVLREYGCGATDSGSPIYRAFRIKPVLPFINVVTVVDTTTIDKSLWTRIDNRVK